MGRKLPAFNPHDEYRVALALKCLRDALGYLEQAQCPKTAARVRLAISSAKGAARAVSYRRTRAEMARPSGGWNPADPASEVPPCAASMGCLCAGHARGNPASADCDTSE